MRTVLTDTPKTARPEKRSGFRHPNLLDWVTAHRGGLLLALLTKKTEAAARERKKRQKAP